MAHRGLQVDAFFSEGVLSIISVSNTCFSIFSLAYLREMYTQDHQVLYIAQLFSSAFCTDVWELMRILFNLF